MNIFIQSYGINHAPHWPTIYALRATSRPLKALIETTLGPYVVAYMFPNGAPNADNLALLKFAMTIKRADLAPPLSAINWPHIYVNWPPMRIQQLITFLQLPPVSYQSPPPSDDEEDYLSVDSEVSDALLGIPFIALPLAQMKAPKEPIMTAFLAHCDLQRDWGRLFEALDDIVSKQLGSHIQDLVTIFGEQMLDTFGLYLYIWNPPSYYYRARWIHGVIYGAGFVPPDLALSNTIIEIIEIIDEGKCLENIWYFLCLHLLNEELAKDTPNIPFKHVVLGAIGRRLGDIGSLIAYAAHHKFHNITNLTPQ